MRRHYCAASHAAHQIGRLVTWGLLGMAMLVLVTGRAEATGLRVGVRIHQEIGSPLVPVTRNFRVCFKTDASGVPQLALCADEAAPRAPASRPPAPRPGSSRLRAPSDSPILTDK